jgi:copper chaperone CopZ
MIRQTFRIPDMHCSNCVLRIESLEDDLPGVARVSASYARGQAVIEYDENRLTPADIIAAIRAQGYTAALFPLSLE